MKRKFSVTGWALCTALGVTTLGGCGGGDSSTQVASNTSTPAASTPAPAPTPSGPMAPPSEAGPGSGAPMSGPPAGYGPPGGVPGSSEGSSAGPGSSGQQIPMDGGSSDGMANSGGISGGEPMGTSSGIGAPQGIDAGMANSGGGAYEGSSEGSSAGPGKAGAPYGGSGPTGVSGGVPNSGGAPAPNPADMAQYSNSNGGKPSAPGASGPQTPGLAPLDGGSSGGIGAPVGAPNSFGNMGPGGQTGVQPSGPQKPAEDAPYLEKAKYAFSIGREPDAYKFALAHALSGAEDANAVLDEIQWVKDLMSPNSGVTFALGMELKAPAGMTDYKPIGSTSDLGNGGPGGGRDMGLPAPGMMGGSGAMGGAGGPAGRKDDPETFSKATGEMGRAFIRMFEERFAEGKFGKLFTEVENVAGSINSAPAMDGGMGGFDGGSSGATGLAPIGGPEGMMAPGGSGRGGLGGPGGGGPGVAKKTQSIGHRLTPGLAYIGTGSMGELKTKATKDGFDCLVFFDVQVEQNKRTGRVTNDTRVQVVSLKSGKVIASSKKLNNIEVQKRMEDGQGDGIDAALQVVFSKIDEQVILTSMPTLKPEVAQKRISDLVNSKQVPTLKALGEVCLFHHLKLINDEEKTSAYELLLEGADGNTLGTGSVEDKRAVLDKLMPKQ